MTELTRLLTQAACNLSGHPVKVRWRRPSRKDARAIAFKTGGHAVIDLHPSRIWAGDNLLYTICHEAAHVRQLWPEWTNLPDYPSGSIQVSKRAQRLPVVEKIEDDADTQARRWMDYAKQNYKRYLKAAGWNGFTAKLLALLDWSE